MNDLHHMVDSPQRYKPNIVEKTSRQKRKCRFKSMARNGISELMGSLCRALNAPSVC